MTDTTEKRQELETRVANLKARESLHLHENVPGSRQVHEAQAQHIHDLLENILEEQKQQCEKMSAFAKEQEQQREKINVQKLAYFFSTSTISTW